MVGDADRDRAVVLDARPLVGLHEFQIAGNFVHVVVLGAMDRRGAEFYTEPTGKQSGQTPAQALPSLHERILDDTHRHELAADIDLRPVVRRRRRHARERDRLAQRRRKRAGQDLAVAVRA